jgi:PKD repeat protein
MASIVKFTAAAAIAAAMIGCTTKKTEPPAPSGPSEFGTSITLTASPDVLSQDGKSESQVTIVARDVNGQPVRNLALRADIFVGSTVVDFGSLSQKNLTTGSDGRATVTYRAPEPVDNVDRGTTVTIQVTPSTGDAAGSTGRSVDIRLVPTGVVGGETAVPDFVVAPSAPNQLETVTFDASSALDGGLIKYEWDFGDGSKSQGRVASHQFRDVGTYTVTLTVTDLAGRKGSRSKNIAVGSSGVPSASFVFSPASPGVGEEIAFNGSASTAIAPRAIVKYDWQFGTDKTASGMIVFKKYDTPGTYNVTLTVTDDAGNVGTASEAVTVGTASPGGLSAKFTFSPTDPTPNTTVNFNASTSTGADPIVEYRWDFGNGATSAKATPTVSQSYDSIGTYVVTLRIKDSKGRTAITTANVTVVKPPE